MQTQSFMPINGTCFSKRPFPCPWKEHLIHTYRRHHCPQNRECKLFPQTHLTFLSSICSADIPGTKLAMASQCHTNQLGMLLNMTLRFSSGLASFEKQDTRADLNRPSMSAVFTRVLIPKSSQKAKLPGLTERRGDHILGSCSQGCNVTGELSASRGISNKSGERLEAETNSFQSVQFPEFSVCHQNCYSPLTSQSALFGNGWAEKKVLLRALCCLTKKNPQHKPFYRDNLIVECLSALNCNAVCPEHPDWRSK